MSGNDTQYPQKIAELENLIKEKTTILTKLKSDLQTVLDQRDHLKLQESSLKQQLNETKNALNNYKTKTEEIYSIKLPETEWLLTREQIHLDTDKYNIELKRKKMNMVIESWQNTNSNVKEESVNEQEASTSTTQWSSDSSGTIGAKMELEAQAAEISLKKTEYLESIDREEKRHKIFIKRNQAYILKLRKDLQRSEAQRKESIEMCKQVMENIEKRN